MTRVIFSDEGVAALRKLTWCKILHSSFLRLVFKWYYNHFMICMI